MSRNKSIVNNINPLNINKMLEWVLHMIYSFEIKSKITKTNLLVNIRNENCI